MFIALYMYTNSIISKLNVYCQLRSVIEFKLVPL